MVVALVRIVNMVDMVLVIGGAGTLPHDIGHPLFVGLFLRQHPCSDASLFGPVEILLAAAEDPQAPEVAFEPQPVACEQGWQQEEQGTDQGGCGTSKGQVSVGNL